MDCENTNNFFQVAKNQFVEPIYNWVWRTNPYLTLTDRSMYDYMDGLQPDVVTTTSELPTSYPTSLPSLALSDGSGSSCDVEAATINDGTLVRNYNLEFDAFASRVLCLTDLQFDWQAAQAASNLQKNLAQYVTVRWSDWYRIKNICMSDNKISTGSGCSFDQDVNSDCDFSGVSLPTAELSWDHLNSLYDLLIQQGAELNAVGWSEGQPLFALSVGPGYKRKLWQDDTKVRDTVNWGDAFQNFTARGINTSINGYIPNVDNYIPRLAGDGTTFIYPTINVAASKGRRNIPNPAYKTVANGGSAVYEVAYILPRNVYEVKVRPSAPSTFGEAAFNPINYFGEITWINNRTFCGNNDQGNKGYYRMDLAMAAKPVRPEIGYVIITLAKDAC